VLFVFFVVRLDFLIEHGNLGAPVRKICASLANFEQLQCKGRKISDISNQPIEFFVGAYGIRPSTHCHNYTARVETVKTVES